MRRFGCLIVVVLIVAGLVAWSATKDMTHEQRAHWLGQKVHRGWNQARKFAGQVKQGWDQTERQGQTGRSATRQSERNP